MKKIIRSAGLLLAIALLVSFAACGSKTEASSPWDNALYTENTEFGEGSKTVEVEVLVEENSVTFTVHTDAEMVGQALLEHELIAGDESEYGLYVKQVNGITADYDVDQSYWAFNIDGEYAMTGVDTTPIEEGVSYQLVYTK